MVLQVVSSDHYFLLNPPAIILQRETAKAHCRSIKSDSESETAVRGPLASLGITQTLQIVQSIFRLFGTCHKCSL